MMNADDVVDRYDRASEMRRRHRALKRCGSTWTCSATCC